MTIVWTPLKEEQCLVIVRSIYSMMLMVQIIYFLYKIKTGKNGVGSKQEKEKEREREES
jgi:hypothetical protein